MDTRGEDVTDARELSHSTGWVARRLGIAPATLRTWHRRYRVGPTGRTAGGHRRYLPQDLDRLDRMRRLMLAGSPTAEAARVSADPRSAQPAAMHATNRPRERADTPQRVDRQMRRLTNAAMALEQSAVETLLADTLRRHGVVTTWTTLIVPVMNGMGERYAGRGDCIAVEHLFTESVRAALTAVITGQRHWDGYPPALLTCPDQEQHSLTLHALGAALAEIGCPTRILGASVPTDALVSAIRQIAPRAVFIWAHTPATARLTDLHDLPRPRTLTPVLVGGPGWQRQILPDSVLRVDSLADAVAALSWDVIATAR